MAPIAALVYKQSRTDRLGIGLISVNGAPVTISSIVEGGLFASSELMVGMEVLTINNVSVNGMTSGQAIQLLKDAEGQVILVADNPVHALVVAPVEPSVATSMTRPPGAKKRGYIILKKTFKYKTMSTEKAYSFHGPMSQEMVDHVNERLRSLRLSGGANWLQFSMDNWGHFRGVMNHAAQKYHEEDFVVVILEAMEELGYYFRFEYDAELFSIKLGDSFTAKELFIFHKMQD